MFGQRGSPSAAPSLGPGEGWPPPWGREGASGLPGPGERLNVRVRAIAITSAMHTLSGTPCVRACALATRAGRGPDRAWSAAAGERLAMPVPVSHDRPGHLKRFSQRYCTGNMCHRGASPRLWSDTVAFYEFLSSSEIQYRIKNPFLSFKTFISSVETYFLVLKERFSVSKRRFHNL